MIKQTNIPLGTIFKAALTGVWYGGDVEGIWFRDVDKVVRLSPQFTDCSDFRQSKKVPDSFLDSHRFTWSEYEVMEVER